VYIVLGSHWGARADLNMASGGGEEGLGNFGEEEVSQLRRRLAEAQNSLHHLQRSQQELRTAIECGEDDSERTLQSAFDENEPVTRRLLARIDHLSAQIQHVQNPSSS